MKTWVMLGVITMGAWGCTSAPKAEPVAALAPAEYAERSTGALLFDPPVTRGQPGLMLARGPREPEVFLGYQDLSMTYFWLRRDDWQMDGFPDQYTQRAVSERVGVRYR